MGGCDYRPTGGLYRRAAISTRAGGWRAGRASRAVHI